MSHTQLPVLANRQRGWRYVSNSDSPTFLVALVITLLVPDGLCSHLSAAEKNPRPTGLAKVWETPLSVDWPGMELRTGLDRLSDACRGEIILDRRLDPSREVRLSSHDQPAFDLLLDSIQAQRLGVTFVGSVAYVGPIDVARRIRTEIELRRAELAVVTGTTSGNRVREALNRGRELRWDDLAEPRQLVLDWCRETQLEVFGLDLIPHDLWRAGGWAELNSVEGLTLLLAQFDLSFSWRATAGKLTGIDLQPADPNPRIERVYNPKPGTSPDDIATMCQREQPLAQVTVVGKTVRVQALLEEHDHLATMLRNTERTKTAGTAEGSGKASDSIKLKRFTLTLRDVPAQALLDTLSKNADARLTYVFDEDAFRAAGIKFTRPISVDVRNAPIDKLLDQIASGLGISYKRDDRSVEWLLPAGKGGNGTAP